MLTYNLGDQILHEAQYWNRFKVQWSSWCGLDSYGVPALSLCVCVCGLLDLITVIYENLLSRVFGNRDLFLC